MFTANLQSEQRGTGATNDVHMHRHSRSAPHPQCLDRLLRELKARTIRRQWPAA